MGGTGRNAADIAERAGHAGLRIGVMGPTSDARRDSSGCGPHGLRGSRAYPAAATEGRANPKGIPVLYLSTHRNTAMSEVRPWLGSLVSCAHFKTTKPLKIIDLSVYHRRGVVFYFDEPDASEREEAVWTDIGRAFTEPMAPADTTADYVPTQVIAELFKSEGCDGLAYKSAFGDDGYNIALFDPADAELTSCTLFEVKSLEFQFEQNDTYWIKKRWPRISSPTRSIREGACRTPLLPDNNTSRLSASNPS